MAYHLSFLSWANTSSSTAHAFRGAAAFPSAAPYAWFGWVGVEVFFVISGFVIANSAMGATPGAFLKSRVLRLLPAAWVCATITLLVREAGRLDPLPGLVGPYVSSLVLWPPGPWIDGVYWSLAVEITFYALIFALLCVQGMRWLPLVAWWLTFASGLYLIACATHLDRSVPGWWRLATVAAPLLLRHGALFAVGVWLWWSNERRLNWLGTAGFSLAVAVGALEIWLHGQDVQATDAVAAGQPLVLPVLIWASIVAVLMIVTRWPARFTPRSERVRTWLRRIGSATYPLYLIHNVVGATVMRGLVLAGAPKWIALGLAALVAMATAFLVALALEPRVRRVLKGLIERVAAGLTVARIAPPTA